MSDGHSSFFGARHGDIGQARHFMRDGFAGAGGEGNRHAVKAVGDRAAHKAMLYQRAQQPPDGRFGDAGVAMQIRERTRAVARE